MNSLKNSSHISIDTIKKIANLARLELSVDEQELYSKQLGAILDYVSQLSKVNTDGVAPLVTATDMSFTMREDLPREPGQGFGDRELVVANAPEKSGRLFKVPPVL